MSLPTIPGLTVLSEIGRDAFTRRFRLLEPRPGILVLFTDPVAESQAMRAWKSLRGKGGQNALSGAVAAVERTVEFEGRRGMVLRADTGENPWTHSRYGELDGMPVVAAIASGVAGLLRSELGGHGHLRRGALDLLYGGAVQILPPFVLEAWLAEQDGAPLAGDGVALSGYEERSIATRDLMDVAALMAWLIGGVPYSAADGGASLSSGLAEFASPGTAQHVKVLVELAETDPSAEAAAAALDRLARRGAGRAAAGVAATARARGASEKSAPEVRSPTRAPGADPSGDEKPPRARVRRPSGAGTALVGFLMLVIGAWVIDGGKTVRRLVGALQSSGVSNLEGPSDPMKNAGSSYPEMAAADEDFDKASDPDATLKIEGLTPAESAQKILADMAAARAAKNRPPVVIKPSYDRSKIDEGDRLRKEGEEVFRQVIEREIPFAERNANLERAIKLLEDAREKFLGFQEQYPDKADLVDGLLQDTIAILRIAYKSKTH